MNRKLVTFSLVLLLFMVACSNESAQKQEGENEYSYRFVGEGDNWQGEYVYEGVETLEKEGNRTFYENEYNDEFNVTYKGSVEELQSVKEFEYSYETSIMSGSGMQSYDEDNGPLQETFQVRGSGNGPKLEEEEIVTIYVKWGDQEETFELKPE